MNEFEISTPPRQCTKALGPGYNTHEMINYVLCSSNFQDLVVIHPPDINNCAITSNYKMPSLSQVRNSYFKYHRQLRQQQLHEHI